MRKIILIGLAVTVLSQTEVLAQAQISSGGGVIYINKNEATEPELTGKRGGYFGNHYLGEDIQQIFDKFQKYYVSYESTGGAYASEKKIIHKKEIYKAIMQFDKFFKKELKSENVTLNEAQRRFGTILNSAINIRFYDTTEFENLIASTRDLKQKEHYFMNVRLK